MNLLQVVGIIVASSITANASWFISNLDETCMQCLCQAATGCNHTIDCDRGYCGPLKISRLFWKEAGRHVLEGDDPERLGGAYEDCSKNYHCAKVIVQKFMAIYGKDCNNDGVTDCDDYSLIHFHGPFGCTKRIPPGTGHRERYKKCRPSQSVQYPDDDEETEKDAF